MKWIPIADKVPDIGQWVLIYCANTIISEALFNKNGFWSRQGMSLKPIYWVPMPDEPGKK